MTNSGVEQQINQEIESFHNGIMPFNYCVDPCFMTGMGCGYTHDIETSKNKRWHDKDKDDQGTIEGFVIMPFQPQISVFFKNTLKPFFENSYCNDEYKLKLVRADLAQRTGSIICEGICKQIQESDFVITDISIPGIESALARFEGMGIVTRHGQKYSVRETNGK